MVMISPRKSPAVGEGLGKDAMRREYNAKRNTAKELATKARRKI
jgi:hypothetical protein